MSISYCISYCLSHCVPYPITVLIIRLRLFLALLFALIALMVSLPVSAQSAVAPPVFSTAHSFFNAPFQLTLSSPTEGAIIRYTTDFTTPTPVTGTLYTGPILINGTTVIRAVAYLSATVKSASVTQSYIFLASVKTQPQSPTQQMLSLGWQSEFAANDSTNDNTGPFPADYGMDPDILNHANSINQIDGALLALPSISLVTDPANLWNPNYGIYYNPNQKDGDPDSRPDPLNNKWERPISIEWIDPTGAPGFSENGGARIHGQASRRPKNTPKKTLRIYFKAAYGSPKLDFSLFDQNDPVGKFDRIVLRNGGNRTWPYWDRDQRREADYVNDEWSRRTWLQMGHLTSHGSYAHLYINGLYWGLINVAERLDEKMLSSYLGGKDTDYDYIVADEDFGDIPTASAGTLDAYRALTLTLSVPGPISNTTYQQVAQMMDMEDFADYMLHTHYIGKTDWPNHNWNAYRKRTGPDTRFRWMTWDDDSGLNKVDQPWAQPSFPLDYPDSPSWMFVRLITNAEFRQLFADRIYKHVVAPDGTLTPANCAALYSQLTNLIDQAIIAESARWGDYSRDVYHRPDWDANPPKGWPAYLYSRDLAPSDPINTWSPWSGDPTVLDNVWKKSWVQVRSEKLSTYCPGRSNNLINQYLNYSTPLYQTSLVPPNYSQRGGSVAANYNLAISNPNTSGAGDIYYTTDGSDPRTFGGSISISATFGNDAANLTVSQVTRLKARIKNGTSWSPLMDYTFYPPQPFASLVINEIHYNPLPPAGQDGDGYEFIELFNASSTPLRLDNVAFTRGISFRFPSSTTLSAGQLLILASDATKFKTRYGFDAYGVYRGNLSNSGEAVELRDAVNNLIDFVDYKPAAPWPTAPFPPPNDQGPSLQLNHPGYDNSLPTNWHMSSNNDGNPAQLNQSTTNQPPIVSLTNPASGASFSTGTQITITANASDPDGTISQVEFQANGLTICTDTLAPFRCLWTPSSVGNFNLTAIASDNNAVATSSSFVTISVTQANGGALLEQAGTVVIEAENFQNKVARSSHDWQAVITPTGFSGVSAMSSQPNNGGNIQANVPISSPEMSYPILFATTGLYNVWVRAMGPTSSDDSIHVGLDGVVRASPAVTGASWFWKKAVTVTVSSPGIHSLQIWMREDGASIDKLLLTTANTTPSGLGPAESPRSGGSLAPSIAINSPLNVASFVVNTPVNITANASDTDGTVTQVVFQANGTTLCTDTTPPTPVAGHQR